MTLLACGLNHKTAPIALREALSVSDAEQPAVLQQLMADSKLAEATVLSTCNRTELYCTAEQPLDILPTLSQISQQPIEQLRNHMYFHQDIAAIKHSIRVCSGLDSMALGEPQIFGQMKLAVKVADTLGTLGPDLRHLFRHAFAASKRIRTETAIGKNPVSIAFAAVDLLQQSGHDLSQQRILLIGAGETSTLVGKYCQAAGAHDFLIANRTTEKATQLTNTLGGRALSIADIPYYLSEVDIVITATACPLPFISVNMVQEALNKRRDRPLLLLDLAIPRDIEPAVHAVAGATVYNVDDLQNIIARNLDQREVAAERAEAIVDYEAENFLQWQRIHAAGSSITAYRERMLQLADDEMQRALQQWQAGDTPEVILQQLTHRLTQKLIHHPSTRLRTAAGDDKQDILALINYLYQS